MDNMIDLDKTFLIQLVNFIITLVVLNFMLIKPVRNQIAARKTLTSGYVADIDRFTSEANAKLNGYEAALSQARAEAAVSREAAKAAGFAKEQAILQKAQADAQDFIRASRDTVAKEAASASQTLLSRTEQFAAAAVAKILG